MDKLSKSAVTPLATWKSAVRVRSPPPASQPSQLWWFCFAQPRRRPN